MNLYATTLGQDYNLKGYEMNRVLIKLGFLQGEPGDYYPTDKGAEFFNQKNHHRGNGGYSHYNKYWSTISFDENIKEHLNITPELVDEVRIELRAERIARYNEQEIARQKANEYFFAKMAENDRAEELAKKAEEEYALRIENMKKTGVVCLVVIGGAIVVYGIYKTIPKIKKWVKLKKKNNKCDEEICSANVKQEEI